MSEIVAKADGEAPDESEPLSEDDENEALWHDLKQVRPNNNIHHVVPVGVLVVLFTLYLSALALQKNCEANASISQSLQLDAVECVPGQDTPACKLWLLKEAEDSCLTSPRIDGDVVETQRLLEASGDREMGGLESPTTAVADKTLGNGNGKKPPRRKLSTKRKSKMKSYSHKYHNKSAKSKGVVAGGAKKSSTKRTSLEEPRKTSAAEPIIYLFALVFIYLLLKAASDINQHYKSRNKGDKRMRRCSLQSYAQTHRQDRRSSKEFGGSTRKPSQGQRTKYICLEARSQSFDPQTSLHKSLDYAAKKQRILANLRQYTSVDGQSPATTSTSPSASPPRLSAATSLNESAPNLSPVMSARRCSMPVAMLTQPLAASPTPTCPDRRVSLGMGPSPDPIQPEVKRRVRMINRH